MTTNFKYCYKDEIHKSYSIPSTLSDLMQDIKSSFNNNKLPTTFSLRYKDNDGDFITISSDAEYNSMLKFDTPNCRRTSFKIYIISSRSSSTTDKEGSFEVIDTSHNTSEGGISEFSLTSKDCEEPPMREQNNNISPREEELDDSPSEQDRAPANSLQRSKVLMDSSQSSDWKDEHLQLSFPDVNEESGNFGEESLNEVCKPVAEARNEQELMSPSLSAADSDMNVSLGREKMENSLEKIFDRMEPMDYRSVDYKDNNVMEENDNESTGSRENSVVLREIDNFMEKLAEQKEQKEQKKEMESSEIEVRPLFNAGRIVPVDLFDRRRQEKINKRKNQAARVIQRAFRAGLLNRQFYSMRDSHFRRMLDPYTTETAVAGLTSHIKARLQALIEAQIPRPMDHIRQTHITPQEISFEIRRRMWDLDLTEPVDEEEESNRYYSPEQSVTEKLEESGPLDTSIEGLMCRDPSYQAEVKNCNDYYNYRSNSDRILSLHDSRVETPCTPCLEDLLNQSNDQIEHEETRLELPVVEVKANPAKYLNYRVMLGMSSSLLFLGGEEGQGVVYKTVYMENNGTRPWRKCYVKPVGDTEGKTLEFYNVDVGEISLLTLELNGYFEAGVYNSQWKLVHENEHGMMEPIGEPFEIEFSIDQENIISTLESILPRRYAEDYQTQDLITKYLGHEEEQGRQGQRGEAEVYPESYLDRYREEDEEEEDENEQEEEDYDDEDEYEEDEEEEDEDEDEEEEEDEYEDEEEEYEEEYEEEEEEYNNREQMRFNKYCDYREEILKIREMRKIFPLDSLDELIEFVDTRPQLSVEELLIGYLALKNNSM